MIDGRPLSVSYGLGVDSTAVLVGLVQTGIRPDLIMFADVGAETRPIAWCAPIRITGNNIQG
jgi:hypothetical protein